MITSNIGKITDHLYKLADSSMPIYLLDGEKPAIFDSGFAYLGPLYTQAIEQQIGPKAPVFSFLTHAHYDHCGAIPFFKDTYKDIQVLASKRAKEILSRPNAIALITTLNNQIEAAIGQPVNQLPSSKPFRSFAIDKTIKDGDIIEISKNIHVKVFETPGHTKDCLSYYIPEIKALISSEALGVADSTGYIFSEFLIDYDIYIDSMKRLADLDVDAICLAHNYVYTGQDAKRYIPKAILQCQQFYDLIKSSLLKFDGDIKRVINVIKAKEYDNKSEPKQPEPAYLLNLEAKIKAVMKKMKSGT